MQGKPLISTLCFVGTMLQCTGAYAYSSTKTGNKGGTDGDIKLNIILLIILVLLVTVSVILFLKKRKGKMVNNNEKEPKAAVIKPTYDKKKKKEQISNNVSLYCINGEYAGKALDCEGSIILGRDPDACNLVFADKSSGISGVHCIIENKDGKIILTDKSSTYGTYLGNGVRLSPGVPYIMNHSDEFYLGSRNNLFIIK